MRTRATVVTLLLLAAVASAVAQEPTPTRLIELRQHLTRGVTGVVEGRIYIERRRPDAPDEPLAGVGILVVPRSTAVLEQLETIKRAARESMPAFRDAAPAVRAAMNDYELELWQAGYPDAAIRTSTDADGRYRAVAPPGAWIVYAERSVFLPVRSGRTGQTPTATALDPLARYSASQYQHFLPTTRVTGFDAVSVWLREVTVEAGQRVTTELHDRGLWMSGVVEEHDVARRVRFSGRGKKQ